MLETDVFKRREADAPVISAPAYNIVMGLVLLWGFAINWLMVKTINPALINSINPWIFSIGYLVCCYKGVTLFNGSKDQLVSFLGYNMIVVPIGLVVNTTVAEYDPDIVADAMRITGWVTAGMMCLGSLFPVFFKRISTALAISLLLTIIVEVLLILVFGTRVDVMDWIVAVTFCCYIGLDWGRANQLPKTVDNAVDSAAALYLDIINLFLRILRILGRKDD